MTYQPDWDIDLKDGKYGESIVKELLLLDDAEIEVKHDRLALMTGNVYVETHCRRRDGWHESGICTTKAKVWFFVLDADNRITVSVTTEELRRQVKRFYPRNKREEKDGSHPTRGVVVPLAAGLLRKAVREAA